MKCWIEYINYVVAIDCGDYPPKKWDYDKANEKIKELNSLLSGFERRDEINGYSLYLGYLEEVVFKKRDRNGQEFSFNDSVHIFNLDFCNSLTTAFNVVLKGGNVKKYYKNQVIRKLLELQSELDTNGVTRFIMFVTLHTHFWEDEAKEYFSNGEDKAFINYRQELNGLPKEEVIVRLLRYYFFDIIKNQFTSSEFIPDFFPVIIYEGTGDHKLICFTIAGTLKMRRSGIAPFYQKIEDIINSKFLTATEEGIIKQEDEIDINDISNDPINCLEEFKSYKDLWL